MFQSITDMQQSGCKKWWRNSQNKLNTVLSFGDLLLQLFWGCGDVGEHQATCCVHREHHWLRRWSDSSRYSHCHWCLGPLIHCCARFTYISFSFKFLLSLHYVFSALTLLVGDRKGIWPVKKLCDGMLMVVIRLELVANDLCMSWEFHLSPLLQQKLRFNILIPAYPSCPKNWPLKKWLFLHHWSCNSLWYILSHFCCWTDMGCMLNVVPRPTEPGHPSVGRHNEYWWLLRTPLGKKTANSV